MFTKEQLEQVASKPEQIPPWTIEAARSIRKLLGEVVERNTKVEYGYFMGTSIFDVARIIQFFSESSSENKK